VSKDFDAYLRIEDEQGKELAWNDDGGGERNARIAFRAPADGVYRVIATTFHDKAVGKFVLNVRSEGEMRNVLRIDGQITAGDERDTVRTESVRKVYEVKMSAGREYVIDLRSEDFDSYLRLEGDDRAELARDDDSGGFPHARIRYRAARDGVYRVIATTYRGGAYGRFSLSITEEVLPR
jgi:hypothetical protein